MNHADVRAAVLDPAMPRDETFEPHLRQCADCAGFAASHRAASALTGTLPQLATRRPMRVIRRRAVGVGVALLVTAGVAWWWPPAAPEVPQPWQPEHPTQRVAVEPAVEDAGSLTALAQLAAQVSTTTRANPREDPLALRTFGALARLTAPPRMQPLRSLGKAASPVVFTSEDLP